MTITNTEIGAFLHAQTADGSPATDDEVMTYDLTASAIKKVTLSNLRGASGGDAFLGYPCQGRLTLTTATPVTTADVTGAATLYFTPYKGDYLALYTGAAWEIKNFSELSLSLAGYTAAKPYDIFVYDNGGTVTLESCIWTNGTTRATALALQNGVLVKTGAATRRYLGTIYMSGTGTTEDSLLQRYVWNYYNRFPRKLLMQDTTASWTYNTNTWRQARATAGNKVEFVVGVSEDIIDLKYQVSVECTGAQLLHIAIGINLTNAIAGDSTPQVRATTGGYVVAGIVSHLSHIPAVGYSYAAALEKATVGTPAILGTQDGNQIMALSGLILG